MTVLAFVVLSLALFPALLFIGNLRLYRREQHATGELQPVSILIPARNEAAGIGKAVQAALASEHVEIEVVVMDDHSEDSTAAIVQEIAQRDSRARLIPAPPLPTGWCGKQHACAKLAEAARHPILLFVDADVQLQPQTAAHLQQFLHESGSSLVSGIPHQKTTSLLEKLLIPLIHFILLGFLPFQRMRRSTHPSYAAGCGQLFMARADAYHKAGGHSAIRASRHDGITLPRVFRQADEKTDLMDATDLAECHMYDNASDLWQGLTKNTTEGLGSPKMIVPITILLIAGQVLPFALLPIAVAMTSTPGLLPLIVLSLAAMITLIPRVMGVIHFRQSWLGALLHPLGILLLVVIQWHGLARAVFGKQTLWKGRST